MGTLYIVQSTNNWARTNPATEFSLYFPRYCHVQMIIPQSCDYLDSDWHSIVVQANRTARSWQTKDVEHSDIPTILRAQNVSIMKSCRLWHGWHDEDTVILKKVLEVFLQLPLNPDEGFSNRFVLGSQILFDKDRRHDGEGVVRPAEETEKEFFPNTDVGFVSKNPRFHRCYVGDFGGHGVSPHFEAVLKAPYLHTLWRDVAYFAEVRNHLQLEVIMCDMHIPKVRERSWYLRINATAATDWR
ncbi:hypothetical protein AVEN_197046-1 [Araneus ventricosus]|uniref:Uncharacterized protein n=1 Tax=Araneus ventricosus TaxID=182803 RepID=A0A4Y2UEU3_ARAVE|nr:hypothetical protein AVEN_197046-1 [Araneus ventricosus]